MLNKTVRFLGVASITLSLCGVALPVCMAQDRGVEIAARPLPGQLDVLQGTAIQLGGKPRPGEEQPASYEWRIVEGEGGQLYQADRAEAIFRAPKIDTDIALFVVELTSTYAGGETATSILHVRVFKEQVPVQPEEEDPAAFMDDFYKEQVAKDRQRKRHGNTVIIANPPPTTYYSPYPGWHGGWGWGGAWGWGGMIHYPSYVPVQVPAPGITVAPGDAGWSSPAPIPYDAMVTTFPHEVADQYLPQDYPQGSVIRPSMTDYSGAVIPPADSTGGAAAPAAIDPAFATDPFGW